MSSRSGAGGIVYGAVLRTTAAQARQFDRATPIGHHRRVRIIGGQARGRTFRAPAGNQTRPTADRVREALFSLVLARVPLDEAQVLDLYAGSGALGLEALSRGAARAVCVDRSRRCTSIILDNAGRLGFSDRVEAVRADVSAALGRLGLSGGVFDLVLADPPYDVDPGALLTRLDHQRLVHPDGLTVVEHAARRRIEDTYGRFLRLTYRVYGDTALSLYAVQADRAKVGRDQKGGDSGEACDLSGVL